MYGDKYPGVLSAGSDLNLVPLSKRGAKLDSTPFPRVRFESDNRFTSHVGFLRVIGSVDLTLPPCYASKAMCDIPLHRPNRSDYRSPRLLLHVYCVDGRGMFCHIWQSYMNLHRLDGLDISSSGYGGFFLPAKQTRNCHLFHGQNIWLRKLIRNQQRHRPWRQDLSALS